MQKLVGALLTIALIWTLPSYSEDDKTLLKTETFSGLKMRALGPALMSGRIADIAIDPNDPSIWYVGVASGGVWKTVNAGTTWTPLFDDQSVYSIGDVTLDPSNSHIVWVGTGENNGGRHIGFGDGVYKSEDGGQNWQNMGLKDSQHISDIVVHPTDSQTVWVSSQGPLWSAGGERGLFKTTDGGKTWRKVLKTDEWTGVTALSIDPRNPDRLYAATWQRQRTVAAYIGAGPESGLWRSEDGGETWQKLKNGLPTGNIGKIGLAVSPVNPDILYAAIEQERRKGGVWRSADRGASWTKMSDTVAGGTGPHYYQEIYASPHALDLIYLVSNYSQVSDDGGRTFRSLRLENKHVDDHAIAFRADDPDYLLTGSDGGLYESFDQEKNWRFINNLPVTQFYKVAVDDADPFYFIYGGTQDNSTQGGPSRTANIHGVRNSDWFLTVFADGHQPATEPGNPDIVYSSWQQGNLVRVDRKTDEVVHIQPQPRPGDPAERFNWDAPIFVSQHDPKRLYHASQRVWRSDNRGDSWTAISPDLTRNQNRMLLPVMGRQWSWEAGWDMLAMSNYNTITSIAESPLNENILYVGTDDGIIQVTENGGETWRQLDVGDLPDVPETAFVNDIRADLFDENTVYVALDNHKYGDYTPYLLKSTNRGKRWTKMTGNLPDKHLVWRIVQDHKAPDLFFLGTEFGLYFTVDAGEKWVELTGNMPTVPIRDVTIQRREDDVVAASFGRGFFVLDDLSALRSVTEKTLDQQALLFSGRRAYWYVEKHDLSFSEGGEQGASFYRAENPPFGAVFTYYLKDGLKSSQAKRIEQEKPLIEKGKDTPFPGFDVVEQERRETPPQIWLVVKDGDGNVIRRIAGDTGSGFQRVAWDLRVPSIRVATGSEDIKDIPSGWLALPGDYTVTLISRIAGETEILAGPQDFSVVPLPHNQKALEGAKPSEAVAFWQELGALQRQTTTASAQVSALETKLDILKAALNRSFSDVGTLDDAWQSARDMLFDIEETLGGNQSHDGIYGARPATILSRVGTIATGVGLSTYGPTQTHREQLEFAREEFSQLKLKLARLKGDVIPVLEASISAVGGPFTVDQVLP